MTVNDIAVTGGELSNFAGSGTNYTADFTPNPQSTTAATVNVAGGTFTDAAGNDNTAATPLIMAVNTVTNVTFAIHSTSEATGNDSPTQSATISEENTSDNTGTFTIIKGGDALTGSNTASVTVTMSGTATDADFSSAVMAAVASAATTAGLTVSGQTATTVTLTWDASDPTSFNVDLTAFNDQLVDSGETLTLTLSGQTVANGSASLVAGQSAANLTVTDIDSDVTFAIHSTSEATGNDSPTQSATISEENTSDNTGTFTIIKGGNALTGSNTASVTVTMSGTATDADFSSAVMAAVASAATTAGLTVSGQTATTVTLTWDASDPTSFNVDLTAFNDQLVDSGETLTLTLSGQTVANGSASLVAGQSAANLTVTDIDSAEPFTLDLPGLDDLQGNLLNAGSTLGTFGNGFNTISSQSTPGAFAMTDGVLSVGNNNITSANSPYTVVLSNGIGGSRDRQNLGRNTGS